MRRTRIKFCGFTRAEDLDLAIRLGVDAVGLIAVPGSKRAVQLDQAAALRRRVPAFVSTVLLFLDPDPDIARQWIAALDPDLVQFHGRETPDFCHSFGHAFLKALPGGAGCDLLRSVQAWSAARGILFDAHEPGACGGTGQAFDWHAIPQVLRPGCILSGGLTPGNVRDAIALVRPWAVDVASGIESAPGIKSPDRMRAFVAAVRAQDASDNQKKG